MDDSSAVQSTESAAIPSMICRRVAMGRKSGLSQFQPQWTPSHVVVDGAQRPSSDRATSRRVTTCRDVIEAHAFHRLRHRSPSPAARSAVAPPPASVRVRHTGPVAPIWKIWPTS